MKKVFVITFVNVELSESTSIIVDANASGPLNIASAAAWGTYVKTNIAVVTPIAVVIVGASLDHIGRQRSLWEAK